jgi:hypothetical protein
MPAGAAELLVEVPAEAAFTFLADPRNAGEWFSAAGFASPPEGKLRQDMTWTVAQTAETRRPVPTRMTIYEPPSRFAWATVLGPLTVNWTWQLECRPAPDADPSATLLHLTIRLRPGIQAPITLIFGRSMRRTLDIRAARALERAHDALIAPAARSRSTPPSSSTRKRRRS